MTEPILCLPNGTCIVNNTASFTEGHASKALDVFFATMIICAALIILLNHFMEKYKISMDNYLVDPLPKYSIPKDYSSKEVLLEKQLPKETIVCNFALKTMEEINTWINMPRDRITQRELQKQVDDYFLGRLKKNDENVTSSSIRVKDGLTTTTWGFNMGPTQQSGNGLPAWSFQAKEGIKKNSDFGEEEKQKQQTEFHMSELHLQRDVMDIDQPQRRQEPQGREGDVIPKK